MNNQQRQQVTEQVSKANNVLVAVSSNPTVDELAASVGLTLALNHLGKHATTVFSGVVPSTIEFLQPEKTIETTTDSLRDFIIALDKAKADKLRYKVEDDVVRIFITPYHAKISERDLEFSHGDFNVDVVVSLGVRRQEDLDKAITAHGRILHDATVVALSHNQEGSELGSVIWQEPQATSLCEMVATMMLDIQKDIIDGQMATAFLTGIIAETDRFKNEKTTPYALSVSSELMSMGANQQLIAEKLEEPERAPMPLHHANINNETQDEQVSQDGTLSISHSSEEDENPDYDEQVDKIHIDEHGNLGPHQEVLREDNYEPKSSEEEQRDNGRGEYLGGRTSDQHQDDNSSNRTENFSGLLQEKEDGPTLSGPANEAPVMRHEKKIIAPPPSEDRPRSDKPFDLNAAIQAANEQGIPVEAAPNEPGTQEVEPETELTLPEPQADTEPPKITQEHNGPMLSEPSQSDKLEELVTQDQNEAPSGAPRPAPHEAAEHSTDDFKSGIPSEQHSEAPPQPISLPEEPQLPPPPSMPPTPVAEDVTQTLAQLEQSVDSPHSASQTEGSSEQQPTQTVSETKPSVDDPTKPPAVPPPLNGLPQFYDADGNNSNPFLNPNNH